MALLRCVEVPRLRAIFDDDRGAVMVISPPSARSSSAWPASPSRRPTGNCISAPCRNAAEFGRHRRRHGGRNELRRGGQRGRGAVRLRQRQRQCHRDRHQSNVCHGLREQLSIRVDIRPGAFVALSRCRDQGTSTVNSKPTTSVAASAVATQIGGAPFAFSPSRPAALPASPATGPRSPI